MNHFSLAVLCFVLGCVLANAAKEKNECYKNTCSQVLGQSGKILIHRGSKKGKESNALKITFDEIMEVDADGNQVGKGGSKDGKHSFNTFAPLDFTFSNVYNTTVQGVKALAFNFTATIPGPNASLSVEMFFLKENSSITLCSDEVEDVKRGMVKFNIDIKGWTFCGGAGGDDCKKGKENEEGKYIDFTITLQSPGGKKIEAGKKPPKKEKGKTRKTQKVNLGKMKISLPQTIEADGICTTMPDSYPKNEMKGDKVKIKFRFPKFTSRMVYDPVIDSDAEEPADPDSGSASLHGVLMLPAVLISLVYMLW